MFALSLLLFAVVSHGQLGPSACSYNSQCPDLSGNGPLCRYATGVCSSPDLARYQWGHCAPRPEFCSNAPVNFVCGCDLKTYRNGCAAFEAGTSILHLGNCTGNGERCKSAQDCKGKNQYCKFPLSTCGGVGVCATRANQTECPLTSNGTPMCSCSGNDYDSACLAAVKGESIASLNFCKTGKTCQSNGDCGSSGKNYCAAATCGATGTCVITPEFCTMHYDPVCGCDGHVYSNSCVAASHGVVVSHKGPCGGGNKKKINVVK